MDGQGDDRCNAASCQTVSDGTAISTGRVPRRLTASSLPCGCLRSRHLSAPQKSKSLACQAIYRMDFHRGSVRLAGSLLLCCDRWHSSWTHQMPIGAVGNLAKTGCAENGPSSNPPNKVCHRRTYTVGGLLGKKAANVTCCVLPHAIASLCCCDLRCN